MSNNKTIGLRIEANASSLNNTLNRSSNMIQSWASKTRSTLSGINTRGGNMLTNALGIGGGIAAGATIYQAAKEMLQFEHQLNVFRITTQRTVQETELMKKSVLAIAQESGIAREELLGLQIGLMDKTGSFEFAKKSLSLAADAILGLNSNAQSVQNVLTGLNQNLKVSGDEASRYFDILDSQGMAGSMVFEDMAANFDRISASMAIMGTKGIDNFKDVIALIQTGASAGSPEEIATSLAAVSKIYNNAQKIMKLTGFKMDYSKQFGQNIQGIVQSTLKKTGTDAAGKANASKLLGELFGEEGIKVLTGLIQDYADTGKSARFESLRLADSIGIVNSKAKQMQDDSLVKINKLKETMKVLGDELTKQAMPILIDKLTEFSKDPKNMTILIQNFETLGKVIGIAASSLSLFVAGYEKLEKIEFLNNYFEQMANEYHNTQPEKVLKSSIIGNVSSVFGSQISSMSQSDLNTFSKYSGIGSSGLSNDEMKKAIFEKFNFANNPSLSNDKSIELINRYTDKMESALSKMSIYFDVYVDKSGSVTVSDKQRALANSKRASFMIRGTGQTE